MAYVFRLFSCGSVDVYLLFASLRRVKFGLNLKKGASGPEATETLILCNRNCATAVPRSAAMCGTVQAAPSHLRSALIFEQQDQPHFVILGPGRSCVALRGRVKQATHARGTGCLLLGMLLRRRWKSTKASFILENPICMQTEVTLVRICRGYGAPIPCFRCRVPMVRFHLRVLGTVLRVTRSSHGRAPLIKLYLGKLQPDAAQDSY